MPVHTRSGRVSRFVPIAPVLIHTPRRLVTVAALLLFPALVHAAEPEFDLRVLIDVSGSMKTNDPENLRQPALRLVAGILPDGAKAGVWTFGRWVNMQVPYGTVNAAWRDKARKESRNIHSYGLHTNIEEALQKSTWDWTRPKPGVRRHLVLLSDGRVDMSKDEAVNARGRKRILESILPRLKRVGATVHTVALSDDADRELLHALAAGTGGRFIRAGKAAELDRIFLDIFETAAKPVTMPLRDDTFRVDDSIKDITLLVFRKDGAPALVLTAPDGSAVAADKPGKNVTWYGDARFDLVSIAAPATGEWRLNLNPDEGSRLLIVSNLGLAVEPLPARLFVQETVTIHAALTSHGKPVTSGTLLDKLALAATARSGTDSQTTIVLADDGKQPDRKAGDGIFAGSVAMPVQAGTVAIDVTAAGPTFERLYRHALELEPAPLVLTAETPDGTPGGEFGIELRRRDGVANLDVERVSLQLPDSPGSPVTIDAADGVWPWRAPMLLAGQTVEFTLRGRHDGRPLELTWRETLPAAAVAPALAAPEAAVETPEPTAPEPEPFSWLRVVAIVVFVNAVLLAAGFLGWQFWLRRRRRVSVVV